MSQGNVEIVRRSFEVFNRDGIEGVIAGGFWSLDFVWDASPMGIPGIGLYSGYDEIREGFEDWFGAFPFEEWEVQIDEIIDHGDQVVVMSRQRGRGANSGVMAELEMGQIVTMRDGKGVRLETHLDRNKALEAAGLSE